MHLLVGRILQLHLPSMWWRRWRRNEEQLARVRQIQVLVSGLDVRVCAKVDLHHVAHDSFAIEDLLDADGGVFIVEGDDDAREGLEWCPGVDGGGSVDEVFDCEEVFGTEDIFRGEIGDDECIRRGCGHAQRRQIREI